MDIYPHVHISKYKGTEILNTKKRVFRFKVSKYIRSKVKLREVSIIPTHEKEEFFFVLFLF